MRIKLEKVTGVVALSYLALIPLSAYYAYRRLVAMEQDIVTMWDHLKIDPEVAAEITGLPSMERLRRTMRL